MFSLANTWMYRQINRHVVIKDSSVNEPPYWTFLKSNMSITTIWYKIKTILLNFIRNWSVHLMDVVIKMCLRPMLKIFIWCHDFLWRLYAKGMGNISKHFRFSNFFTFCLAQLKIVLSCIRIEMTVLYLNICRRESDADNNRYSLNTLWSYN